MGGAKSLVLRLLTAAMILTATQSCTEKLRDKFDPEKHDKIDRELDLSRDDYRNMGKVKKGEFINKVEMKPPPLPDLTQILAAPRPPAIGERQLVSIAVTDDIPLKDVLFELAKLADVDIELDAGIEGGISFVANDKPFNEVIDRIADLAGLRYSMRKDVLRVERDVPYMESYVLDFLNIERSSASNVNISTNVLSAGGSGGGLNTGSTQTISSQTESDFWPALRTGLQQILNFKRKSRTAEVMEFDVNGENVSPSRGKDNPMARGQVPGLEDCAINLMQGAQGAQGGQGGQQGQNQILSGGDCQTFYSFNRQAGILSISATKRQHEMVERFLEKVKGNASAQVLIEAKIVEISLNDSYQSGIEWAALNNKLGIVTNFNTVDPTGGVFTLSLPDRAIDGFSGDVDGTGGDLDDFVTLVEEFGTTRTLSSPRLHAINNQQAVLTFAENLVYFEIDVERQTDLAAGVNQQFFNVDSTAKTVPIGIILSLQPSVNAETGEITLVVRPTLSRVTGFVSDPAVAFLASNGGINIQNQIPVVEVRELDSILKLKSGQVMVIGGLMEQSSANTDRGVPVLSEVPWVGNLFKSVNKRDETKELIIFVRATLINGSKGVSPADQKIYNTFNSNDPRPLGF